MPQPKNVIDILKTDHERVKQLLKNFDIAAESEKVELLSNIINELALHSTVEEQLVYPLVEDVELSSRAGEEHHVVSLLLSELADMDAADEETKIKVQVLAELVIHHVQEEETKLLPMLQRSGEDLIALGEQVMAQKQNLISNVRRLSDRRRRRAS